MKIERSTKQRAPRYCASLFIQSALYLLLVGCTSTKPVATVMIDQVLMQPCPAMPAVLTKADGRIEMGELVLADIELAGLYKECARSKDGLIEAVKQR